MSAPLGGGGTTSPGPVRPNPARGNYPWYPMPESTVRSLPPMLTVSDVERLAKAGVHVKMEDIVDRVCPNPVKPFGSDVESPPYAERDNNELMKAVWHRLQLNTKAMQTDNTDRGMYRVMPVQAAVRHGDTIYVFVHTGRSAPCVIEDEAVLYPSDALMAKIALLEKVEKGRVYAEEAVQAGSQASSPYTGPRANPVRRQGNSP